MRIKKENVYRALPLFLWAMLGLFAGFLNGLLGAAGGVLLVILLPLMPPLPAGKKKLPLPPPTGKNVFVTGLFVMLPVTLVSAVLYFLRGMTPSLSLAAWIALPAAAGGLIGALLLRKIPRRALRKIFAVLVLLAGIRMVLT